MGVLTPHGLRDRHVEIWKECSSVSRLETNGTLRMSEVDVATVLVVQVEKRQPLISQALMRNDDRDVADMDPMVMAAGPIGELGHGFADNYQLGSHIDPLLLCYEVGQDSGSEALGGEIKPDHVISGPNKELNGEKAGGPLKVTCLDGTLMKQLCHSIGSFTNDNEDPKCCHQVALSGNFWQECVPWFLQLWVLILWSHQMRRMTRLGVRRRLTIWRVKLWIKLIYIPTWTQTILFLSSNGISGCSC